MKYSKKKRHRCCRTFSFYAEKLWKITNFAMIQIGFKCDAKISMMCLRFSLDAKVHVYTDPGWHLVYQDMWIVGKAEEEEFPLSKDIRVELIYCVVYTHYSNEFFYLKGNLIICFGIITAIFIFISEHSVPR